VAYALADGKTKRRERRGIVDACKEFALRDGTVVTRDSLEYFDVEKIKIWAVPLYQWLLRDARQ